MTQPVSAPRESLTQRIIGTHALEAVRRMDAAAAITHPGERGRAREEVLRQYLAEIVPEGFTVATGFVIDSHGKQSRQQDLIIVRRDYHPRFQVGGAQFFTVESVAAVIEVKSTLTRSTLRDAIDNARTVKELDRTGGGENYVVNGGIGGVRGVDVRADYDDHQIMSFIVAARSEISVETAHQSIVQALANQPRSSWPNAFAAADAWYVAYDVPQDHPRTHVHVATGMRVHEMSHEPNVVPLVDIAHDLWSWLRVAPVIDVRPHRYVLPSTRARVGSLPQPIGTAAPPASDLKST